MFQGLSTALTSLYAQRQALETTGNNIANVNTEGYTRQRVELSSVGGNQWSSFFSTSPKVGLGVNVDDIARLRDQFLETRGLQEHSNQGELNRTASTLKTIELAFGEPGDTGLQEQLSQFWSSWDDVANRPDDLAARSQVTEQAQTLVSVFGQASSSLDKLAESALEGMKSNVTELNTMAQNIADLNNAIKSAVNSGQTPNSLLDKRDLLVGKMSELVGVTVQPTESGSISINVGGVSIVRDDRVTKLRVDDTTSPVSFQWDGDGDLTTTSDGYAASVSGGDLGGLIKSVNVTIPKYQAALDAVAANLISAVNTQHAAGIDQNGTAGGAFFVGTSAKTIGVDPALAVNSKLLAARSGTGGALDGENARKMANLADAQAGPDANYREMINLLGIEAQRSYNQVDVQTNITNSVDAARQSVSGVNLDEEMANLIRFQKAYNASAHYMSVIDGVLDSLINIIR